MQDYPLASAVCLRPEIVIEMGECLIQFRLVTLAPGMEAFRRESTFINRRRTRLFWRQEGCNGHAANSTDHISVSCFFILCGARLMMMKKYWTILCTALP